MSRAAVEAEAWLVGGVRAEVAAVEAAGVGAAKETAGLEGEVLAEEAMVARVVATAGRQGRSTASAVAS